MSIVVDALKQKYFELLRAEDYPNTPKITREADELEKRIRLEMQNEKANQP